MAVFANSALTTQTAVTTSAAKVFDAGSLTPTGQAIGDVTLVNTGTVTVFVGAFAAVTAVTGVRVPPGASLTLSQFNAAKGSTNYDLYAITASGTSKVTTGPVTIDYIV